MTLLSDPDELDFDVDDDEEGDFLRADVDSFEDRAYIEHYVERPQTIYDYDYDPEDHPYGYGE